MKQLMYYLREALKSEAIKSPGMPGMFSNMLIIMAGIICNETNASYTPPQTKFVYTLESCLYSLTANRIDKVSMDSKM